MAKHDILEELIKLFGEGEYNQFGLIIKPFLQEIIESLPKVKVGNKFITSLNIPINKNVAGRKSVNIVQDSEGNLIGLISTQNENMFRITKKISPNCKSITLFNENGKRVTKTSISNNSMNSYDYNCHGTNPVRK